VVINAERALYWLGQGAQPTDAVAHMLKKQGILDRFQQMKAGESTEAEAVGGQA